eukprot:TRINITY_DN28419_c0_g1_i1.p1 TRINITY_DN28419_c0_g1~~TRINITY_DN28419_c0_g1_i1.p1  ORF type:complete len:1191 (-),score=232.30 TRINITY_DN28419_c0_g1_i1:95-3382(-)
MAAAPAPAPIPVSPAARRPHPVPLVAGVASPAHSRAGGVDRLTATAPALSGLGGPGCPRKVSKEAGSFDECQGSSTTTAPPSGDSSGFSVPASPSLQTASPAKMQALPRQSVEGMVASAASCGEELQHSSAIEFAPEAHDLPRSRLQPSTDQHVSRARLPVTVRAYSPASSVSDRRHRSHHRSHSPKVKASRADDTHTVPTWVHLQIPRKEKSQAKKKHSMQHEEDEISCANLALPLERKNDFSQHSNSDVEAKKPGKAGPANAATGIMLAAHTAVKLTNRARSPGQRSPGQSPARVGAPAPATRRKVLEKSSTCDLTSAQKSAAPKLVKTKTATSPRDLNSQAGLLRIPGQEKALRMMTPPSSPQGRQNSPPVSPQSPASLLSPASHKTQSPPGTPQAPPRSGAGVRGGSPSPTMQARQQGGSPAKAAPRPALAPPQPLRRAGSPPAAMRLLRGNPTAKHQERASSRQASEQQKELSLSVDVNFIREVLVDRNQLQRYASNCFKSFDSNKDGVLSFSELEICMQQMNAHLGIGDFTEGHVMHYLRRFDTDGDRLLSESEFEQLYRSLLLVKLEEMEPAEFCREMFISRRKGRPEDHYRLQGVLGAGSFGVVRKVQCRQTKVTRVMKAVDKNKALSGGYPLKLIMEEIDKLKTLDHPAVLRLFEYFADANCLYLITDLLPGGDLLAKVEDAHAAKQPLEEPWVCDVFCQVCEGVAYCHAKGVMHKDLKLENVMLCSVEPPEAVVIDVGLAELFPPSQAETFKSADAAGTLATMAPEVIRGSFTAKCDVWSLGCCLYALLNRRPRRVLDSPPPDSGDEKKEEFYDYFYPFRPPPSESRQELKAYLERQRVGPDVSRLGCGATAEDMVKQLLAFEHRSRPVMQEVLKHKWLQASRAQGQVLASSQLDSLLQFHRINILAQAVLLDMASQLPLGQLRELTSLFESLDKDGNGMLDQAELSEALQGAGLLPDAARKAADRLARGAGGRLEFSRFVAALVPSCQDLLEGQLVRSSFNRLDANGDGFVSRAELQRLLERGGVVQSAEDEEKDSSSSSGAIEDERRDRAARSARHAFDAISGEGRVRVSYDSFRRYLGDFVA